MVSKAVAKRQGQAYTRLVAKERAARVASGETVLVEVRRLQPGTTLYGYGGDAIVERVEGGTAPHHLCSIRTEAGWRLPAWADERLEVVA